MILVSNIFFGKFCKLMEDVKLSSDMINTELFTLKYSKPHSNPVNGDRLSN